MDDIKIEVGREVRVKGIVEEIIISKDSPKYKIRFLYGSVFQDTATVSEKAIEV